LWLPQPKLPRSLSFLATSRQTARGLRRSATTSVESTAQFCDREKRPPPVVPLPPTFKSGSPNHAQQPHHLFKHRRVQRVSVRSLRFGECNTRSTGHGVAQVHARRHCT